MSGWRLIVAFMAAGVSVTTLPLPNGARLFRIPADELPDAIATFAEQCRCNIIYRSDEVGSARSRGAVGLMASDRALHFLLDCTGFGFLQERSGAYAVVRLAPVTIAHRDDATTCACCGENEQPH